MMNDIREYVALGTFGFEGQMITPETLLHCPEADARPLVRRGLLRLANDDETLTADEEAELQALIDVENAEAAAAEAAAAEAAAAEAAAAAAKPAKTGKAK